MLIVTIVYVMFLALVENVKIGIEKPKTWFNPETKINYIKGSSKHSLYGLVQTIVSLCNILLNFYKTVTQIIKFLMNLIKTISEYTLKFLMNYVKEIRKLIAWFLRVFMLTVRNFIRFHLLPLMTLGAMGYLLNSLLLRVQMYIDNPSMQYLKYILIFSAVIFGSIIIVVWSLGRQSFSVVIESISISNIWLTLVIHISILLSSLVLVGLSKLIAILPFSHFGQVTRFGFGSLVLLMVLGLLYQKIFPARNESD